MINGLLTTLKDYKGIDGGLDSAIEYILSHNLDDLPLGKSEINPFVTITRLEYVAKDPGTSFPEEHKKHLDLQILTKGQELCYFDYLKEDDNNHIATPYNEEKDVIKYDVPLRNKLIMNTENFTLFTPSDVHLPSQKIDEEKITKYVIKVLID